jgi:hypothetical protein
MCIQPRIPHEECSAVELHLLGEDATPPSARAGRRLAVLQLVVIAGYYASLCLARHRPARTLDGVQLPMLGKSL